MLSESTVNIPFGGDKRIVGLFLRGLLDGMLKMVCLVESGLRFLIHKAYIKDEIHVNREIGEPHV